MSWHPAYVLNEDGLTTLKEYEGVTFYFCSQECKKAFDADPLRYVDEVDLAEARAKQQSQGRQAASRLARVCQGANAPHRVGMRRDGGFSTP